MELFSLFLTVLNLLVMRQNGGGIEASQKISLNFLWSTHRQRSKKMFGNPNTALQPKGLVLFFGFIVFTGFLKTVSQKRKYEEERAQAEKRRREAEAEQELIREKREERRRAEEIKKLKEEEDQIEAAKRRREAEVEERRKEEAKAEARRKEEAKAEARRKEEAEAEARRNEAEARRNEEAEAKARRKKQARGNIWNNIWYGAGQVFGFVATTANVAIEFNRGLNELGQSLSPEARAFADVALRSHQLRNVQRNASRTIRNASNDVLGENITRRVEGRAHREVRRTRNAFLERNEDSVE
jgi:hypothetical protein